MYYVFNNKCIKQSCVVFEIAGLSSYIRGCGNCSKNVQECSFMHKIRSHDFIRPIVNWVAMVCNIKKWVPREKVRETLP